jgi:two-component system, LytTR family, sensor kinase
MDRISNRGIKKNIIHLVAWIVLLGLPLYSAKRLEVGYNFLLIYYIIAFLNGLIFYINYLLLVPRLFFQKNKLKYYLSALALVVGFYFVSDLTGKIVFNYLSKNGKLPSIELLPERGNEPGPPRGGLLRASYPFRETHPLSYGSTALFIVFFSLGLKVLERQSKLERIQEEMERTKLNTELAFLKNQISPHFFFNTLNNIYSLISINAEDSQKAILKLSKLMRYLLYETEHGNTSLSSEIDFMNNYIDLMKLRITDKVDLKVSFPEKCDEIRIPPMLFVPFIENAFKHGVSYREKSFIDINMRAGKENITLRCANSNFLKKEDQDSGSSGIGLENVSKRLNLIFPGKHELKINKTDTVFEILLFINLV